MDSLIVEIRAGEGGADAKDLVLLQTRIDGQTVGDFEIASLQLFCTDEGEGTLGGGVTVGFDADAYTTETLDQLDGQDVELVVEVTDQRGITGAVVHPVVIRLGER